MPTFPLQSEPRTPNERAHPRRRLTTRSSPRHKPQLARPNNTSTKPTYNAIPASDVQTAGNSSFAGNRYSPQLQRWIAFPVKTIAFHKIARDVRGR